MSRFAVNLSTIFTELPFLERFGAAARAGFTAVECQFPYEAPADAIAAQLTSHGLTQVMFNLPAGDWAGGERGIACLPGREAEFRASVETALEYSDALGVGMINCLAGIMPPGADRAACEATLVANLRHAAARLAASGRTLLLEAINSHDMPGFYINTQAQALDLIRKSGASNIRLQCDLYHVARMGEDIEITLQTLMPQIGHIQFADMPGRHQPGSGTLPFAALFRRIDALGYQGFVSAEYVPSGRSGDSFGWFQAVS